MDEAHSYTSFHGSNVYHVLKRMKNYMKKFQIVGSSATLDNSKEFFQVCVICLKNLLHISKVIQNENKTCINFLSCQENMVKELQWK